MHGSHLCHASGGSAVVTHDEQLRVEIPENHRHSLFASFRSCPTDRQPQAHGPTSCQATTHTSHSADLGQKTSAQGCGTWTLVATKNLVRMADDAGGGGALESPQPATDERAVSCLSCKTAPLAQRLLRHSPRRGRTSSRLHQVPVTWITHLCLGNMRNTHPIGLEESAMTGRPVPCARVQCPKRTYLRGAHGVHPILLGRSPT